MTHHHITAAGLTDPGCVRDHNEDSFLIDIPRNLFLVADGMGGYRNGAVASRAACELFSMEFNPRCDHFGEHLSNLTLQVNRAIFAQGTARGEETRMGTTFLAAAITGSTLHLCHLGDVRAYRLRAGVLHQLSRDHSTVADMVALGLLSPEEALVHPMRHLVNRCLGLEVDVSPECREEAIKTGDRLLLCSDGLWNEVPDPEIETLTGQAKPLDAIVSELVARARERGGHDNITALLVELGPPPPAPSRKQRQTAFKKARLKHAPARKRSKR